MHHRAVLPSSSAEAGHVGMTCFVVPGVIVATPDAAKQKQRCSSATQPYSELMVCLLVLQAAVERYTKTDPATAALHRCYRGFSRLSVLNERLGLRSGYTKGGACSR
jgi:hypothetical protein